MAKMCFSLSLLAWKLDDSTGSTTGYLLLLSNKVIVTIWLWFSLIYGYCAPRSPWFVCHLDGFFSVLFGSYLAVSIILFIMGKGYFSLSI